MHVRTLSWTAVLVFLALGLWLALAVDATDEAQIRDLGARVDGGRLLASFTLHHAFDEDFRRRIASGLPTELIFRFEIERDRTRWFDATMVTGRLQVIAMYNAVTGEYLVNFKHDGSLITSRVVRDPEELQRVMTVYADFPVFSVEGWERGEKYQLRVRAELGTHTVLAFIPRILATEWAQTHHFRLSEIGG